MLLSVALNANKRRDLQFYAGDEQTLTLMVYALDGDATPIAVTDPRIVMNPAASITIPVSSQFTVPDECCGRSSYRLVAEVAGVTTTLAQGIMTIAGGTTCWPGYDYGGPYGWPYGWGW